MIASPWPARGGASPRAAWRARRSSRSAASRRSRACPRAPRRRPRRPWMRRHAEVDDVHVGRAEHLLGSPATAAAPSSSAKARARSGRPAATARISTATPRTCRYASACRRAENPAPTSPTRSRGRAALRHGHLLRSRSIITTRFSMARRPGGREGCRCEAAPEDRARGVVALRRAPGRGRRRADGPISVARRPGGREGCRLRGGARRPGARGSRSTLSARTRAPTTADGPLSAAWPAAVVGASGGAMVRAEKEGSAMATVCFTRARRAHLALSLPGPAA